MDERLGRAAELAQHGLSRSFRSRLVPGRLRNTSRFRWRQSFALNYWWLAHAVEVRVDAFERTGDPARLAEAERLYAQLKRRNRGLFNDYFDDMGWLCIAALRLHDAGGSRASASPYLADAVALFARIHDRGWNPLHGESVSWRVQQPGYKNAPSNGAFAIAALRLFARTGDERMRVAGEAALSWLTENLLSPGGLVVDGLGRTGGAERDDAWVFSYNQGLYVGALVEAYASSGDETLLARAARTAEAAIAALAPDGVIRGEQARLDERGGGDVGLFKGVFVRYLALLVGALPPGTDRAELLGFLRGTTSALAAHLDADGRAGDDWSAAPPPVTAMSTQLSAVMALEAVARL
ncbi:glycoside hydrolase family 76 protein [Herbiconiux sp. 11R-BC]|uniref:glycoside hydrolase family 76 protein n=1 Tax=Herbiconiux sp. 11R-BC TaxID=3111637 RepID=UPI003C013D91